MFLIISHLKYFVPWLAEYFDYRFVNVLFNWHRMSQMHTIAYKSCV